MRFRILRWLPFFVCILTVQAAVEFDRVIAGGRVIDPESGLDGVRHLGISEGLIAAMSTEPLTGRETIDARGRIVAPGFIDLHQHALTPADAEGKVRDGVTLACELEVGAIDVDAW